MDSSLCCFTILLLPFFNDPTSFFLSSLQEEQLSYGDIVLRNPRSLKEAHPIEINYCDNNLIGSFLKTEST
jgi:hypothetical protein